MLAYRRKALAFSRMRGQLLRWLEVECAGLGVAQRAVQGPEWAARRREREPADLVVCVSRGGGELDEMHTSSMQGTHLCQA